MLTPWNRRQSGLAVQRWHSTLQASATSESSRTGHARNMLFLDEFGWRVCRFVAVALFCGSTVSLSWASNRETPKPCTSQGIGKSIAASASERIAESEASHSAEPLRVDPAERNRAAKRSAAAVFFGGQLAEKLVSG